MPELRIRRSEGFNIAAPGVNTNILGTSLGTKTAAASAFHVSIALAVGSVFNITETVGGVTNTYGLNDSVSLDAGDLYEFEFTVSTDGTYNFQVETDGIVRRLIVDELASG